MWDSLFCFNGHCHSTQRSLMTSPIYWRLRNAGGFFHLPPMNTSNNNKELALTRPLDLESLYFCHNNHDGEVGNIMIHCKWFYQYILTHQIHWFANTLIYHGLLEFYGEVKPLWIGIKNLGILNSGHLPLCMVAFVITGVSYLLILKLYFNDLKL